MEQIISVLIADDNLDLSKLLNEYISREKDMTVVGIVNDGANVVNKIIELKPDVVILDIIMPNLDGIGVLEKINELKLEKRPSFIMLSAIGQDIFIQRAIALGAEYYMIKPFNTEILISRIKQIIPNKQLKQFTMPSTKLPVASMSENINTNQASHLEAEVTGLMREIGVPPHVIGYQYIREAIIRAIEDHRAYSSVTRTLYPAIAKKFSTTSQKVERSIRNAIECTWSRGNQKSIDAIFGPINGFVKEKPTNSEFIAILSDKIRVQKGLKR